MKLPRISPTSAARAMPMPKGKASRRGTSEAARGRQHETARAGAEPQRGERRGHCRVAVDIDRELCAIRAAAVERSEEHTSELQSLMRSSYAVFCLKKKK